MEQLDTVVVGAGVVGLAVARALALKGREVVILESQSLIGSGTSSRNSEVIHAGIYYPQGSLKSKWCVQGKVMLYDYCESRQVAYKRCGKLIVATHSDQVEHLRAIEQAAKSNGVLDLQWLNADQARAIEPDLACTAALLSPSTGIVDSHGLMLALQGDLEQAGGIVVLQSEVTSIRCDRQGIEFRTQDGQEWGANTLVNCAGHGAPGLASTTQGLSSAHAEKAYYAKGNYFSLVGRSPFRHLIYPVPQAAGLGVHLTLDLAGQAKFGPDVQWTDSPMDLVVDPQRGEGFYAEVRKYWPDLPNGALSAAYAGIRPKINGPNETSRDFVMSGPSQHGVAGLVNLMGIESPGLTSCLAIGEAVCQALIAT
jgi:L-2-hydroxyglutarate oxidase LhgO